MEIIKAITTLETVPYDSDTGERVKEVRNGNLVSYLYESYFKDVVELKKAFLDKREALWYLTKQRHLMASIMNGTDTKEG